MLKVTKAGIDPVCVIFKKEVKNEQHLKKVPVMENGHMIGIINGSNITKYALNLYHQQLR